MSFLSDLVDRSLGHNQWYVKVNLIAELSEIARSTWLKEWTSAGRPLTAAAPAGIEPRDDARWRELQSLLTQKFIAEQAYLPEKERDAFGALLRRGLSAAPDADAASPAESDRAHALANLEARFATELAEHLASGSARDRLAARITDTLPQFVLEQNYITALAFGDNATAQRLKDEIAAASAAEPRSVPDAD